MPYERVAIVHDWLTSMRGGERVVEAFYRIFPRADLFTLTWDPTRLSPALSRRQATTSAIHQVARAPLVNGRFRALLPFFPLAIESFDLGGYDLVVSSSHCVAIGAIAPPAALHVAYVHSTLRYVREGQPVYEASVPGGLVGRAVFRGAARYLRSWETAAAARPHELIANSSFTRDRIRRYYGRDACVIEPPIETARFERAAANATTSSGGAPFLVVSALVPNKRVDLALRAFQGRRERLVVVGEGPEHRRLQALAGPNVTILPRVGEAQLAALVADCRALLHPGVDDFGMVMVEALAAGRPVIACAEGGALDIVRDGETGLLVESPTVESVRAAIDRFVRLPNPPFDPVVLRRSAKRFDTTHFERRFAEAVEEAFQRRQGSGANDGRSTRKNGRRSTLAAAASIPGAAQGGRQNGQSARQGGPHGAAHYDLSPSGPADTSIRVAGTPRSTTRGSHADGNHANGNHANGNHANGNHANGNRTNGNHANGNRTNGNHANGNRTNGNHANGSHANGNRGRGRRHLPVLPAAAVDAIAISTTSQNGHAAPGDALMQSLVHHGAVEISNAAHETWTAVTPSPPVVVPNSARVSRPALSDPAGARKPVAADRLTASGVDPLLVQRRLASHSSAALRFKRLADIVVAASGLIVTAPLVVTLGALIPLTSPGPALFYQKRTGLHQRPFVLVKLRTMDRHGQVTRMGRLLRPLGLDELPQLWNVLRGDMSVVGPRPELPELVAEFERSHPGFRVRHLMRPGITGWAQVNGLRGHPDLSIAERLRFDLQYMCEWGLAFDARILARTFSTVLKDTLRSFEG